MNINDIAKVYTFDDVTVENWMKNKQLKHVIKLVQNDEIGFSQAGNTITIVLFDFNKVKLVFNSEDEAKQFSNEVLKIQR